MPHPLLEDDKIECIHKGKLILQSSTKDLLEINNAGVITINDLKQASIVGCFNNIVGIPSPRTKLVNIPESITSSLLKVE
ncbi:hypothetical protein [Helicobacter sp. MIT 14-3879]|uniref:hypothetical protein n=1 Tax=Helicobacter sp. MIT 14-3879 TaxID=2040649 RepID=UPI0015F13409|nr:hypothetical protein [Helicobacter sp. MIT 14-3879]